jgi:hypothetical protein
VIGGLGLGRAVRKKKVRNRNQAIAVSQARRKQLDRKTSARKKK